MAFYRCVVQNGYGYLPSGYKRCEFIESTGLQRIDTGVAICDVGEFCLDVKYTDIANTYLNGAYGSEPGVYGINIGIHKWKWFTRNGGSDNTIAADLMRHKFVVSQLSKKTTIDGAPTGEICIDIPPLRDNPNLYLFVRCTNIGDFDFPCKEKVFGSYVKNKDGKKIRNLVPALDDEGNPCMFDTVSQTAFYNAGTGEFGYELMDGTYVAPI